NCPQLSPRTQSHSFSLQMDLFLLELWRDDFLSCVRAYSPPSSDDIINDDGIPQFVMQFAFTIKDLVDWENERIVYRDSDDELISIDGVSGDGLLEAVLDALSHWPFIYKIQFSIVDRPPVSVRSSIVDEFPDVSFPEIIRQPSLMIVAKKEEKKEEEDKKEWKKVVSTDSFREFLIELEKRQDEIQQSLRRDSFVGSPICPSVLPSDVLESIANDSTKKRIVPGTPLEDHSAATDSLTELVERVERQLSLLNENTTVTTQTESEWKVEEVSPKKEGRITKYKGTTKATVEAKKQKKNSMDTKVVILKMGKANKDVHRSEDCEQQVYCQSVRVMNLSRNPVQAKIVVSRRSPGAKPVLYRDFVYLQPYVPTKFAIGLVDDLSEETSYVTYTLHLFTSPISPPITVFSPPSSTLIPAPHFTPSVQEQRAITAPSLIPLPPTVLPPTTFPALPAPPRVEALPVPPEIFLSETLRGMISRKNSTEEEGEVECVVDDLVNGAIQSAQKEEENRAPMLIIEETAEEIDEKEREDGGEIEEAEEVKEDSEDESEESMSDVEEINVEDEEDSDSDSEFEVIDNHEE
ncbi:hypothetical protein PMAYCL1PPCAC_06993, partial [Pristionchus mayeri]